MENVLFKIHDTICNLALLMRNTSVVFNSTANDPCLWQHLINYAVAQTMRIVYLKAQALVSRYTTTIGFYSELQIELFLWLHVEHYNIKFMSTCSWVVHAPHVPQSIFAPHLYLGYFSTPFNDQILQYSCFLPGKKLFTPIIILFWHYFSNQVWLLEPACML